MTTILEKVTKRLGGRDDAVLGARADQLREEIKALDEPVRRRGTAEQAHRGVEGLKAEAARELRSALGSLRQFVRAGEKADMLSRHLDHDLLSRAAAMAAISGENLVDVFHEVVDGKGVPGVDPYGYAKDADYQEPRAKAAAELAEIELEIERRQIERDRVLADAAASERLAAFEKRVNGGGGQ